MEKVNHMSEKQDEKLPWERMKGERSKAYDLFTLYRLLGPARSLTKLIHNLTEKDPETGQDLYPDYVKISLGDLKYYSKKYNWVSRCEAWDDSEIERRIERNRHLIDEMNERHAEDFKSMQQEAKKRIEGDVDAPITHKMTPFEFNIMTLAYKRSADGERLALGEATERVEQTGTTKHKHTVTKTDDEYMNDLMDKSKQTTKPDDWQDPESEQSNAEESEDNDEGDI